MIFFAFSGLLEEIERFTLAYCVNPDPFDDDTAYEHGVIDIHPDYICACEKCILCWRCAQVCAAAAQSA